MYRPNMPAWLTYRELADRLGVSHGAAKILAARRGWERQAPNKPGGPVRVLVPGDARPGHTGHTPYTPPQSTENVSTSVPPDTPDVAGYGGVVSISVLEKICADHARQQDQMRSDHAAELARMSSLHLDLIGRIQAQGAAERSLFLERVDAAELRAEAAEARATAVDEKLHQVLDRLLERPLPATPAPEPAQPWWARWFGQTKRSDIGS